MYRIDGGGVIVHSLVSSVMIQVLMLQWGKGKVALHGRSTRHAILVYVDNLNGSCRCVVVLLVMLFAHFIKDDQHDGRHQRDGHKATNDDLRGLHNLIQGVEGAVDQGRDRDGVGLIGGLGGQWRPCCGGGGSSEGRW